VQRNAKDALYQLRDLAAAADRAAIDDQLIAWTTADLAGRMSEGGHNSEQILTAIGGRAGARLAEVVADPRASEASRLVAARLIGQLATKGATAGAQPADRAAREQAGAKLVEMARVERQPEEASLERLGLVGGDHAVAYLTRLAEDTHQTAVIRKKALLALAQGNGAADPAGLPVALRLARERQAPGEVRDAAFELAEKIGPSAVPGLVKLLDDPEEQVRWRAVEAALKAGRQEAVVPVLEAISPSKSYPKDDLRSFVVHDLELIGPASLAPLRDELKSKSWVARLAAAMAIGALGRADDAPRVEAIAGDGTKLKGWPDGATVGSEARSIAVALRAKR
jgi:hypothetical protein